MKKLFGLLLVCFSFMLGTTNVLALDVSQVSLNVEDKSSTLTVIDDGIGTLELSPRLEFNVVGDFITYKLVIKNNDGKKYKIENVIDDNQNEAISIKYDYNTDLNTDNKEILITLKYNKKPTDPNELLKNVRITIKLIDEDDNTQDMYINGGINNNGNNGSINLPKTGDNIQRYIWLLSVSLIGFILSNIYLIKKKDKRYSKSMLSILLLLILMPAVVFAKETIDLKFNISFENIKINVKHKVSFDTKGADEIKDQTVEHNGKATRPTDPIKEHYTFIKWIDEENEEFDFTDPITKDIKLTAVWEKKEYTISYNTDGGTQIPSQTVKYNETFTKPSNPNKEHYTFIKWLDENNEEYDFSTKATKNVFLTAIYEKEKYTITFVTDGGTPVPGEQEVEYLDKVTRPADPEKNKHDFDGWLDEQGNEYNFDNEVTKNMTLTAKWTELFTVTYETNGGGTIPSQTVRKNSKFTKPQDPNKDYYNFSGWYIDATFVTPYDFNEEVTSDKLLYAKYTPIEYTYVFDANGGTYSGIASGKYTMDKEWTLYNSSNEPTRDHYVFKGWTGTGINEPTKNNIVIPVGSSGDRTYTANWEKEKYTVTYNSDGGTNVPSETVDYKDKFNEPASPTKENYIFIKWVDENGLDYDFASEAVKNITLVAKWQAEKATIISTETGGDNTLNLKMKKIANPGEDITNGYNYSETTIKTFARATEEEYNAIKNTLTNDNLVSDSSSEAPVYMWRSGSTMYWYTEAAKVEFLGTMGRLFSKFSALEDISSFADFDTSKVTDMNRIFQNCTSLKDISALKNWDVSKVKSFVFSFGSGATGDAPQISNFNPISEWNVGSCEDFNQMFKYNTEITNLNAFINWDMSSATNIKNMFTGTTALIDASAIKEWNVVNVTASGFGNVFSSSPIRFEGNTDKLPQFTKRPGKWDTDAATVNGKYLPDS